MMGMLMEKLSVAMKVEVLGMVMGVGKVKWKVSLMVISLRLALKLVSSLHFQQYY